MEQYSSFFLHAGGVFVSNEPFHVHTILGSCISVCLWDGKNKIAAMNHFMISHCNDGDLTCKYGNVSLEHMLSEIKKFSNSPLKAYIIGGSNNPLLNPVVPTQNIEIADSFLRKHRIPIHLRDVGGSMSRKIVFNTMSGEVSIIKGR